MPHDSFKCHHNDMLFFYLLLFSSSALCMRERSGGHPKFPEQVCGTRSITWNPTRQPKIIGGETPPLGAVPWVVDLLNKDKHHCGGVLISSRLVLTVAHCFIEGLTVRVGSLSSESFDYEQIIEVERGVQHPEFGNFGRYSNDIALLLLSPPGVEMNDFVKPACIPYETPPPGSWCEVSGWGTNDPRKSDMISPVLQVASVPLLSTDVCRKNGVYGGRLQAILDTMVCAGRLRGGVDACGGDSGGPLTCEVDGRLVLVGLVSWGDGCAKKQRPGVYTRVPSYKNWIRKTALQLGVEYT